MIQHASAEESCAGHDSKTSDTEYEGLVQDDFFSPPPTPPPTPHKAPGFQAAIQLQFEMLQAFVIGQYEKELSVMKEEREDLRRRLLAYENTSCGGASEQCVQEPAEIFSSNGLQDDFFTNEHLLGPKLENLIAHHQLEAASEGELNKSLVYLAKLEQQVALSSDGLREAHNSISGELQLDGLPVAPSSPRQSPCLPEPALVQSKIHLEVLDVTSLSPATAAPPATISTQVCKAGEVIGVGVSGAVDLSPKPEDAVSLVQEDVPLLGRETAEIPIANLEKNKQKRKALNFSRSIISQLYQPDREKHSEHHLHSRSNVLYRGLSSSLEQVAMDKASSLQRFVLSSKFDLLCGGVIVVNTIVCALSIQYRGFDLGVFVQPEDYKSAEETWPGASVAFLVLESAFLVLFLLELLLRLTALGLRVAIRSPWMWFDFFIVVLSVIDRFAAGALGMNTSVIRLFRLVRLVKVLKIFHALQAFDSLFLLVKALQASVHAMTYSFLILVVLQVVVGMFMCQMLQPLCLDEELDIKLRQELFKYFGTFSRSMLSMFEITLANWVPCCRLLVEEVNESWMIFFIFYRCMFCFALLKVISAVFITETNRVLSNDDELFLMRQKRDKATYTAKLSKMFHQIDLDGDGYLTWNELQSLLSDPATAEYLTTLGFQQHDFEKLFWLVDEGSGKIAISDFMSKVGKLKGMSKSIDTLTLLKLTHRIEMLVQDAFEKEGLVNQEDASEVEEEQELFTGRQVV